MKLPPTPISYLMPAEPKTYRHSREEIRDYIWGNARLAQKLDDLHWAASEGLMPAHDVVADIAVVYDEAREGLDAEKGGGDAA